MGVKYELLLLCMISVGVLVNGADNDIVEIKQDNQREGRDYYPSHYTEEEKTKFAGYAEYPPSNYVTYKEDAPVNCAPSPLVPVLQNGLNFLLLKLGAIGLIKTFFAILFFVFLLKLPILLAKAVFFKAILFPALIAPLMMLFSNSMGNNMMNAMMNNNNKPSDNNNNNNNNNNDDGNGRALEEAISKFSWKGFKFLLDSEKCAERMACQVGVYNNDTVSGATLARMAKYIEHSSPSSTRYRIRSLREAFSEGNIGGICSSESYPCEAPRLLVSQGGSNIRVL